MVMYWRISWENDENRNRDWATIGVHGVDSRNMVVSQNRGTPI